jgi:tumor protein p53-inducible protein 3
MRALIAASSGGPEVLTLREQPEPVATPEQVLVDVQASALNRADLLQARGSYPPPVGESDVLGLEAAGIERDTGRKVCCLLGSGGCAEVVAVDRRLLMPVPRGFSFLEAAAIPEVWLTAYLNLFIEGALQPADRVLVHAGASGVGTAAIQLCKRIGAQVIVTSRTEGKLGRCLALGAHHALKLEESFSERVLEVTEGKGVDVVLDTLGGGALAENLRSLATGGRLVCIALMQGHKAELDLSLMLKKRLRVVGSTLRSRTLDDKIAIVTRFIKEIMPGFDKGELAPVIDSTFKMSDVRQAAERLQSNETFGKVTLEW